MKSRQSIKIVLTDCGSGLQVASINGAKITTYHCVCYEGVASIFGFETGWPKKFGTKQVKIILSLKPREHAKQVLCRSSDFKGTEITNHIRICFDSHMLLRVPSQRLAQEFIATFGAEFCDQLQRSEGINLYISCQADGKHMVPATRKPQVVKAKQVSTVFRLSAGRTSYYPSRLSWVAALRNNFILCFSGVYMGLFTNRYGGFTLDPARMGDVKVTASLAKFPGSRRIKMRMNHAAEECSLELITIDHYTPVRWAMGQWITRKLTKAFGKEFATNVYKKQVALYVKGEVV